MDRIVPVWAWVLLEPWSQRLSEGPVVRIPPRNQRPATTKKGDSSIKNHSFQRKNMPYRPPRIIYVVRKCHTWATRAIEKSTCRRNKTTLTAAPLRTDLDMRSTKCWPSKSYPQYSPFSSVLCCHSEWKLTILPSVISWMNELILLHFPSLFKFLLKSRWMKCIFQSSGSLEKRARKRRGMLRIVNGLNVGQATCLKRLWPRALF